MFRTRKNNAPVLHNFSDKGRGKSGVMLPLATSLSHDNASSYLCRRISIPIRLADEHADGIGLNP